MGYYLTHWIVASLTVMIMAQIVPGIRLQNFVAALLAALVIGLVNSLIWPVLVFLTIPFTVITFGLFLLVVNGLALKLSAVFTPGFEIKGFMPAIWGSIVLSILGWLIRFVVNAPPPQY